MDCARAAGRPVIVVPESRITLMGVDPPVKATFAPAEVPETPSKLMVKSTTPGKPSKPEGIKSIVTNLPLNLWVSIPPKSKVPPLSILSSLVYRLKALDAM
jgi:hypothetical protein